MSFGRLRDKGEICPLCGKSRASRMALICKKCNYSLRGLYHVRALTRDQILEHFKTLGIDLQNRLAELNSDSRWWAIPPALIESDTMIVSDVHATKHDAKLLARLTMIARKHGIKCLVIGGDFFDFEEFSSHPKSGKLDKDKILSMLVNSFGVLVLLLEWFDELHVIKGNHDNRFQRIIAASIEGRSFLQDVLAELETDTLENLAYRERYVEVLSAWGRKLNPRVGEIVRWYQTPEIEIAGPPGLPPYRFVHPASYSQNPPKVEKDLSAKYEQPIIGTHGHLFGVALSKSGKYPCAQIGCATEAGRHYYLSESITSHPAWNEAFAKIQDGRISFYVDNPYLIDWEQEVTL